MLVEPKQVSLQNLSDVHVALEQRGFTLQPSSYNGNPIYSGALFTSQGAVSIELFLMGLHSPPLIILVEIPDKLKPIAPHIGANGNLCYTAFGALAMDIFEPASQILACIERAEEVLSDVLDGKRIPDLTDEFFVYWGRSGNTFIDAETLDSHYTKLFTVTNPKDSEYLAFVITEDRERSARKLAAMQLQIGDVERAACVIKSRNNPIPLTTHNSWPLKTLSDLLDWQFALDSECAKKIIRRLKVIFNQGQGLAVIVISSPTTTYSAVVTFPNYGFKLSSSKNARKILGSMKVYDMKTVRIDDQYVAERNQPGKQSLLGLRVLQIGCGAIGGYLADILVRSGAGLGKGELILLDTDILKEGNIGRHKLGFESVSQNKAEALANQIKISFPSAKIEGKAVDVREFNLTSFDLIINATGEQSLSDWLSATINQNAFTPTIHCWIEGAGVVARSFIQIEKDQACYRCLHDLSRQPLYPPTTERYEIETAGQGCESLYIPFPATAAIYAAALAADHVMDWRNGKSSPILRTTLLDKTYSLAAFEKDPIKQLECPACHIKENG